MATNPTITTIRPGRDEDERVVTFGDGYVVTVRRGWTRSGGAGWMAPALRGFSTVSSIREAAKVTRRWKERQDA